MKVHILFDALRRIANEPLELSHEKVHLQIRDFKKIAQKAMEEFHDGDPKLAKWRGNEEH